MFVRLLPHRLLSSLFLSKAFHSSMQQQQQQSLVDQVISYHNRTKHSLSSGYARGPHGLDWANQPNQFLSFSSTPLPPIPLLHFPNSDSSSSPPYSSPLPPPSCHVDISSLSSLLFDSLSLSAWKSTSLSTWPLRVNPSSGNLHPTESHLLLLNPHSTPLLAHYSPNHHSLVPLSTSPLVDPTFPIFLLLSSVFWREAWKYGERALRYCNHDVGHAIAAVAISAASLGWDVRLLDSLGHDDLEKILGIRSIYPQPPDPLPDRPTAGVFPWMEAQHPDCALCIFPFGETPQFDLEKLNFDWKGKPEPLSKEHVYWDVIYKTANAIKKPRTQEDSTYVPPFRPSGMISEELYRGYTVREVVRMRRSAVDMDGKHVMGRDTFYQMLLRCLPSGEVGYGEGQGRQMVIPFRVLTWDAEVHAAIFVHSVEGLEKGIYFLVRNEGHSERLKAAMRKDFEWARPEGCPDGLPLYRLASGNCKRIAKLLSCHQNIASDGCFSLGMIARFEPVLGEKGPWMYPRLFWETGVLGQVLYLEAHAVGVSATGIGCYFDDDVHEVLGLNGLEFQSLYHFTVGSPVVDKRIMSLPAYPGPGIDT